MRRFVLLLTAVATTLVVASGVALAVTKIDTDGSDTLKGTVVGPGESIQQAVNAADPGDTIVVRGVHREDVVIRKNGIKLRGDDAVIEAPPLARADSPCSKVFGPEAICVLGDMNVETGEVTGPRVRDVSVSGFTIRGFKITDQGVEPPYAIDVSGARNATVTGNRTTGNAAGGILAYESVDTTITNNDVTGNPRTEAEGIGVFFSSRTTVAKNDVRGYLEGRDEGRNAIEAFDSTDTTIAGNDLVNNGSGVFVADSAGTKILSNDVSRSVLVGIFMRGPKPANAKVVGNNVSGGAWGMYVGDTERGSISGNTIRDNCAGMFFEAFPSQPVGGFEVKGNTVENNTRSCPDVLDRPPFSGIGIALLGARDMEVKGNQISGNVPSGPTAVSGGVVVATDPFSSGSTIKPRNNTVTGNNFGRNKPDIYWDESGSGNSFVGNLCNSSVPSRLCN